MRTDPVQVRSDPNQTRDAWSMGVQRMSQEEDGAMKWIFITIIVLVALLDFALVTACVGMERAEAERSRR